MLVDGTQFLEDMDTILEGVVVPSSSSASVLDDLEQHDQQQHSPKKEARPVRDLTAHMTDSQRERHLQDHQRQYQQTFPPGDRLLLASMGLEEHRDEQQHEQLDLDVPITGRSTAVGLRERMERYLERELERVYRQQMMDAAVVTNEKREDVPASPFATDKTPIKVSTTTTMSKKNKVGRRKPCWGKNLYKKSKSKAGFTTRTSDSIRRIDVPMVWVVQPVYDNDNGGLSFKFTTDTGACLILKNEEAISCVEIMKMYTRKMNCKTFFQLYTMDGRESRIVKADGISDLMLETYRHLMTTPPLSTEADEAAGPPALGDTLIAYGNEGQIIRIHHDGHGPDSPQDEKKGSVDSRPGQRFVRHIMRRRLKKLIRRQMDAAMGIEEGNRKRSRTMRLFYPFWVVWKVIRGAAGGRGTTTNH